MLGIPFTSNAIPLFVLALTTCLPLSAGFACTHRRRLHRHFHQALPSLPQSLNSRRKTSKQHQYPSNKAIDMTNIEEVCSSPLTEKELLAVNQRLLESIVAQDWERILDGYKHIFFEPEAVGNLVEGLEFHKFYFKQSNSSSSSRTSNKSVNTTMVRPHVRILAGGNAAVVSYVRLTQTVVFGIDGGPQHETRACEETRVWERNVSTGMLLNVHFHRSQPNNNR